MHRLIRSTLVVATLWASAAALAQGPAEAASAPPATAATAAIGMPQDHVAAALTYADETSSDQDRYQILAGDDRKLPTHTAMPTWPAPISS